MAEQVFSDIERLVYNWLTAHKIDFKFQTSLSGGFFSLGGMVVDFLIPDIWVAIRVMGEYWHRGVLPEGKAVLQREQLEAMGWTVVDLWGEDILDPDRLEQAMNLALQGREMLD